MKTNTPNTPSTPNKIRFIKSQSKRLAKTEQTSIFSDHLQVEMPSHFNSFIKPKKEIIQLGQKLDSLNDNNFGIKIKNSFVFILLHLRNKTNKNPINIRIPDICIFNDKAPYDVLFHQNGHIRSYKSSQFQKLNLRQLYKFLKSRMKQQDSLQHHTACFSQINKNIIAPQYVVFTDNQLFLACYKMKRDPFFDNLEYLQIKFQRSRQLSASQEIKSTYIADMQIQLLKLAVQSLLGNKQQEQIAKSLSQSQYLSFCNEKISLFLNYQHNIRIYRAVFHYTKVADYQYVLVNVSGLQFINLTKALKKRQKRLQTEQEKMDSIILMSPQKYQKYKSLQKSPNIKVFENEMTKKFQKMVKAMNINTITQNKRQEVKNELAFKKLHPKSKISYMQVITSTDFNKTKRQLFNMDARKSITRPSKYVLQFYNKVSRSFTEYTSF